MGIATLLCWLIGFLVTLYLMVRQDESNNFFYTRQNYTNELFGGTFILWPVYLFNMLIDYIEDNYTN